MKVKNMACLLIWLLAGVSFSARGDSKNPPLRKEESSWQFANFGNNAEGSIEHAKNQMTITTQHTRSAFFQSDHYSFSWQKQSFPYDDCSRSIVSVVVEPFATGSAGIMMRSSNQLDASNVHLEVHATGALFLYFRRANGKGTEYRRIDQIDLPAEIRLIRQGDTFMSHYKNAEKQWVKGPTVVADLGAEQLTGFYACSGDESQIGYDVESNGKTRVSFRNWNITYEENYFPPENNFKDNILLKEGTLLKENFADGSMSNAPASIDNPIWTGIKHAELPPDPDAGGKRYWHKRGDGLYYLGDKMWADYELIIDLSFDRNTPPTNEFMLLVRYQNVSIYDKLHKYYGISFRKGDKLALIKYTSGGNNMSVIKETTIVPYADGIRHELRIKLLDNKYQLYMDGRQVMSVIDENWPITYGNIGFKFTDVDMNIYRIEVLELPDPTNGSTDNYLQNYYDTPLPAYLEKYGYEVTQTGKNIKNHE